MLLKYKVMYYSMLLIYDDLPYFLMTLIKKKNYI